MGGLQYVIASSMYTLYIHVNVIFTFWFLCTLVFCEWCVCVSVSVLCPFPLCFSCAVWRRHFCMTHFVCFLHFFSILVTFISSLTFFFLFYLFLPPQKKKKKKKKKKK